jgi:hypothetical protein
MIRRKVARSDLQNHTGLWKGKWSPPMEEERTAEIEFAILLAILLLAE